MILTPNPIGKRSASGEPASTTRTTTALKSTARSKSYSSMLSAAPTLNG